MKNSTKSLMVVIILFLCIPLSVFSQTTFIENQPVESYTLRDVRFDVKGITLERLLRNKANIKIGKEFSDRASLEAYLTERKQILVNERTLEQVSVNYTVEEQDSGIFLVDVFVSTTDSWNIIALPYFRYDTNEGLVLSLRGRDYNFLGSMQALILNLDYSMDEQGRQSYGGYTAFGIPFQVLGHDAGVNASQTIKVHYDGRPVTSLTNLSYWMRFSELGFPLTLEAAQGLQLNPDEVANDLDPYLLNSSLSLSAAIPTGLTVGTLGSLSYTPSIAVSQLWRLDSAVRADRHGPIASFSHGLSLGRIDWVANMRKGFSASLSNTTNYNLTSKAFDTGLDASIRYHATLDGKIGLNSRAFGFYSITETARGGLGAYMRGILNARLSGTAFTLVNLEAPVKLFDFPTHLFIKKNWLDFEFQMSPFVDLAYLESGTSLLLSEKLWYSGGLEFFVYPLRMRTFIVRASIGFDLDAVVDNASLWDPSLRDGASPYEVFFGLGLFL